MNCSLKLRGTVLTDLLSSSCDSFRLAEADGEANSQRGPGGDGGARHGGVGAKLPASVGEVPRRRLEDCRPHSCPGDGQDKENQRSASPLVHNGLCAGQALQVQMVNPFQHVSLFVFNPLPVSFIIHPIQPKSRYFSCALCYLIEIE